MGFREGSYAIVRSVEQGRGNYMNVQLSINRKNKNTGEYENEFFGFCIKSNLLSITERIVLETLSTAVQ